MDGLIGLVRPVTGGIDGMDSSPGRILLPTTCGKWGFASRKGRPRAWIAVGVVGKGDNDGHKNATGTCRCGRHGGSQSGFRKAQAVGESQGSLAQEINPNVGDPVSQP